MTNFRMSCRLFVRIIFAPSSEVEVTPMSNAARRQNRGKSVVNEFPCMSSVLTAVAEADSSHTKNSFSVWALNFLGRDYGQ